MEELKISPSQAIFDSLKDLQDQKLCYGFGKMQPSVPFLFKFNENEFFTEEWSQYPEGFQLSPRQRRKFFKLFDTFSWSYCTSSLSFLTSIIDSCLIRVGFSEWECTICHQKITKEEGIDHICDLHPTELADMIQLHTDLISEETDGLNNMVTKLEFDANAIQPESEFPTIRQKGCNISAPYLQPLSDFEEMEEEDALDANVPIDLSKLDMTGYKFPNDIPLSPAISKLMRDTNHSDFHHIMAADELHNSTQNRDIETAETLLAPLFDFISTPFKTVKENEKDQQNANSSQNKQNNQTSKGSQQKDAQTPSKPVKQTIDELTPDEIEEFTNIDTPKKKGKPKKPKTIPYSQTIPADIIDEAIAGVAQQLITNYVDSNTIQIIKPHLNTKKKEIQKKLKEEKEAKKKAEDMKRRIEYKQKRSVTIEKISHLISKPLLRGFMKAEISSILEDEKRLILLEEQELEKKEEQKAGNAPPPILISGLYSYNFNNLSNIKKLFKNCTFATDERGEPKILFRYNANRFDVLVYLQSMSEVKYIASQSQVYIDGHLVSLSIEQSPPDPGNVVQSITGQQMILINSTNVDLSNQNIHFLSLSSGMCSPDYILPPS